MARQIVDRQLKYERYRAMEKVMDELQPKGEVLVIWPWDGNDYREELFTIKLDGVTRGQAVVIIEAAKGCGVFEQLLRNEESGL